jgi:hypothetical protein
MIMKRPSGVNEILNGKTCQITEDTNIAYLSFALTCDKNVNKIQ